MTVIIPFPMVEAAVKEVIETKYPAAANKVGGDLSYLPGSGLYVWISLIGGSTTQVDGQWSLDIHVFGDSYSAAMNNALAIEALLVGSLHVTSTMILDNCTQNQAPAEIIWDDDSVYRIGAIYSFSARRKG